MIMYAFSLAYDLKDGFVGPPNFYLDAKTKTYQVRSGTFHWSMSSTQ